MTESSHSSIESVESHGTLLMNKREIISTLLPYVYVYNDEYESCIYYFEINEIIV